jgi:hypothetical protein
MTIVSCGKKNAPPPSLPVLSVVGSAVVMLPTHERLNVSKAMAIPEGSHITVSPASTITIGTNPLRCLYAHENTSFSIDSIIGSGPGMFLALGISEGKLFCSIRAQVTAGALSVRMPDQNAALTVITDRESHSAIIKTIGGAVTTHFPENKPLVVPACCKTIFNESKMASEPLPLTTKDFEEIVTFLGKRIADSIIDNALCPQTLQNEQNLPPQWEKTPNGVCPAGKEFIDTLVAKDPEGAVVTYKLIDGPKGLVIDSATGIVRFFPKLPATLSIQVAAIDPSNISSHMTYALAVASPTKTPLKAGLRAVLNVPGTAIPGELVRIDASHSAQSKNLIKNLSFRFDVTGDVTWEYPSTGAFGPEPVVDHAFSKEGVYTIRVRVKNIDGRIADAHNRIVVHKKPEAKIVVSPLPVYVHKECALDASLSLAAGSCPSFNARWDLDNNGTWDFPEFGAYASAKTLKKTWNEAGKVTVVLEIRDCFGSLAWASAEVNVLPMPSSSRKDSSENKPCRISNKLTVVKAGGAYQGQVNSAIAFEGTAQDPDNKIKRFFWDFQGDGAYGAPAATGKMLHTYTKPGTFKAVLKVTADDSLEWFDTAVVTVRNAPPIAHAGEDVLSPKGRNIRLKGTGEDPDDRVVLYEWDFDNNGTFDWSSPKSGEVRHVFNDYSFAVLRVSDENGAAAIDTVRIVICPEGMSGIEPGPFCIDNYEWPNKRGKEPLRDISLEKARDSCIAAGKRLCTGKEWEVACAGERTVQFPRSNSPQTQNCNVAGNRFFVNRVAPSGSFPDCKSPGGVFDMNGNVDEWTEDGGGDSAFVYGGSWHHDIQNAQCSSKLRLVKNKGYFYVGFRCCK